MKLNLFGIEYDVQFGVFDEQGEVFLEEAIIQINNKYPKEQQKYTLMHELLHVIIENRAKYVIKDGMTEDEIVDPISHGLYEILKDNPILRGWFFGAE